MLHSRCQEKNIIFFKFFFSPVFVSETQHFARFTFALAKPAAKPADKRFITVNPPLFCLLSCDLPFSPGLRHSGTDFNQTLSFWNTVQ